MTLFIQLATMVYLLFLGSLVLLKSRKIISISFSLFSFSLLVWVLANIGFRGNWDFINILVFARGAFTTMVGVLWALMTFSNEFPFRMKISPIIEKLFHLLSAVMLVLTISPLVVRSFEWIEGVNNPIYGDLYSLFFVYVLLILGYIFVSFFVKFRKATGSNRLQLQYFITGLSLTTFFLLATNLIIPALTKSSYTSQFGPLGLIPLLTFLSLAILRQRLFDLRLIVGRGLVYSIFGSMLYGLFYGLNWIYATFFGGIYSPVALTLSVPIALTLVPSMMKSYGLLEVVILGDLLHTNYDLYQVSKEFIESVNSKLTMDDLCSEIIAGFNSIFKSTKEGILVLEKDVPEIWFKKFVGLELQKDELEKLLLVLELWKDQEHGPIILREDLKDELSAKPSTVIRDLVEVMEEFGIAAILPLNRKVALNGIFIIGDKDSKETFTVEDLNLMETLIGYSSVAIGRAMLFEQAKRFNETLKEEVEKATEKLKKANEELRDLDKMKDDLISIASHELRTPAAIVKGKLHLLKGRIERVKKCKDYDPRIEDDVDVCLSAIEREIEQVNTLLEASRIGRDTMVLEKQPFDITEIVKAAVRDFKEMAQSRGLGLELGVAETVPRVEIDVRKMREVIDNLITNAIKYTEKGGIVINVYKGDKGENVCVGIKDTGLGIPNDEIPHLFSKFYRVKRGNNLKSKLVKPGGTGLGLYVAKNIVEKHGGTIWVESEEGKGSIFTFSIPVEGR